MGFVKTAAILTIAGVLAVSSGLAASYEVAKSRPMRVSASVSASSDRAPQVVLGQRPLTTPGSASPRPSDNAAVKPTTDLGPMHRMVAGHPVVYVTFDDGPSLAHTPQILEILARHHAKATFFVEGRFVRRYPQLITAELAAGHSVGNHTLSHPHLRTIGEAAIRYQLTSTGSLLHSLGANAQCFRPPFGETSSLVHRVEASLGIHEYLWTTETKDWTHVSAALDLRRATAGLKPGAIIVFHDGRASGSAQSVAAVDTFLTHAEALGYVALALPC